MIASTPGTPRLAGWRPAGAAAGAGRVGAAGRRGCGAAALLLRRQRHRRALNAGHGLDRALGRRPQRLQRLRPVRRHGDGEEHLVVGDEDLGDQPERNDVALEIWALDRLQRFEDGFPGDGHGGGSIGLFR
jgi:hypothetical protein